MEEGRIHGRFWRTGLVGLFLLTIAYSPTAITLGISANSLRDLKVRASSLRRGLEDEERFDAVLKDQIAQLEASDAKCRMTMNKLAEQVNLTLAELPRVRQELGRSNGDLSERLRAATVSLHKDVETKTSVTEVRALNLQISSAHSTLQEVQQSFRAAQRDISRMVDQNQKELEELSRLGQTSWNIWAEEPSLQPTFVPVTPSNSLAEDKTYLVVMDLSTVAYVNQEGVRYRATRTGLRRQIVDWLKSNPSATEAELKVLILPDPYYFETPLGNDRIKPLKVNLVNIRKLVARGALETPEAPFASLKQNANPDFMLGRVFFNIKTKAHAGPGSIALSIWVGDSRPVDELSAHFCIGATTEEFQRCENASPVAYSLKGIDSLRLTSENSALPNAALHFVELDFGTVMGVFRCNDCADWSPDDYLTWKVQGSASNLSQYLRDTSLNDFAIATDPGELLQHGKELYERLFSVRTGPDAARARQAFEKFVTNHLDHSGAEEDSSPSIFVRLLANSPDPPVLIPLGFLAPGNEPKDFLGFHFRIESPLEEQSYAATQVCLSNWAMLLPPENAPQVLLNARKQYSLWDKGWSTQPGYMDFTKFTTWISDPTPDESPTALMILSHHDKNRIYFELPHTLESSLVLHNFREPSLAILNACGTAGPGATEFVHELNRGGVESVIATSTTLSPFMAGDFINTLAQVLHDKRNAPGFTISQAMFKAVNQLRDKASSDPHMQGMKYGAKALIYTLVGDGNLRLCLPGEKRP
jgi:hypothetical protein